jgi:hypothetical protein
VKDETGCQHITSRVRAESVHAGMKVGKRVSPTGDLWWCVGCGGLFADEVATKPLALPTATGPWDDADGRGHRLPTAEEDAPATQPTEEPCVLGPPQMMAMVASYAGGLRSRDPIGAAAIDEAVKQVERILRQGAAGRG